MGMYIEVIVVHVDTELKILNTVFKWYDKSSPDLKFKTPNKGIYLRYYHNDNNDFYEEEYSIFVDGIYKGNIELEGCTYEKVCEKLQLNF